MSREDRQYKLCGWLAQPQGVAKERAKRELEVSDSTLKRDIDSLRVRYGMPIVYQASRKAWLLDRSAADEWAQEKTALPGLWFDAQEAHALLTMHQLLAQLDAGGLLRPHIEPLKRRLGQMLEAGGSPAGDVARRIRVQALGARRITLRHFQVVGHATLQRSRLRIDYLGRVSGERSEREVSPQRLVHYRDNWYLDAWCHLREGLRSFSVDAIEQARLIDKPALELDDEQLDAELGSGYGIFAGTATRIARLRFGAEKARWVAAERWHPQQHGRFDHQGRWLLDLPYADPRELVMDILRHMPDVEVLAPEELEAEVIRRMELGLRRLRGLDE